MKCTENCRTIEGRGKGIKKSDKSWAQEAHARNPSYSGVAQGRGPEFKSQYCKKKKSNRGVRLIKVQYHLSVMYFSIPY
jgi:hypothetical protein